MDSRCKKFYSFDEVDAETLHEHYFSPHISYSIFKESTINMMQGFYKAFSTGMVTGRTVTDCSTGPIIYHLLAMKNFIREITIVELDNSSLKELEKWKNKDKDAFEWTHAIELLKELQGNSAKSEDEEEDLREKVVNILKLDFSKVNPGDTCLMPQADIVTSVWCLESISKDHEDYGRNLRKMSSFVKPGGCLILYAAINATYFTVGEHKFHVLPCDESFYRKVISKEGFEIKHFQKFDRIMCSEYLDHEAVVFIIAHKVEEPCSEKET